ncbi:MAG: nucleotide pyrophosphohydrolase [bacterium]|nr:nucleotide pyrophosphohydrolase [bacterium]
MEKNKNSFDDLIQTMSLLRSKDGCPWDKEQTHESLVKYLREETEELIENIKNKKYEEDLKEELADILLQVIFHSQIAAEEGRFNAYSVVDYLVKKLKFRHPHVFGDRKATSKEKVIGIWQEMKKKEKEGKNK